MSIYIMLINYTEQGIRNIKGSPKRAETARFLAKSCGAELKDLYLTMGEYDLIATVESEKDDAVARFALALGSIGNVRSTTLKHHRHSAVKDQHQHQAGSVGGNWVTLRF
jgi:uncharacterized protein with GYD domain